MKHRLLILIMLLSVIGCQQPQQGVYFPKKEYIPRPLPEYETTKDLLPSPIFDENPLWVKTYWKALDKYFHALKKYLTQGNGLYITDWASMDNSERNPYLYGGGTGIDISSEMVLFANNLTDIFHELGMKNKEESYRAEAARLAAKINDLMWDKERKFYFDLTLQGKKAPVNTMIIRGLENYGYDSLARVIALNHIALVADIYQKTGTIWENYAPDSLSCGYVSGSNKVKADFVGWSGIGPIMYFMEYAIGLKADGVKKQLEWSVIP
ncbi:MAG: trehalase family glycosidase [Bacteroidales bacterium]